MVEFSSSDHIMPSDGEIFQHMWNIGVYWELYFYVGTVNSKLKLPINITNYGRV